MGRGIFLHTVKTHRAGYTPDTDMLFVCKRHAGGVEYAREVDIC